MNYQRIYDNIVYKYKNNPELIKELTYSETHHILPKCLGGLDSEDNLVKLPVREHILLHIILTKIYPDEPGVLFAANCMILGTGTNNESDQRKRALSRISTKIIADIHIKSKEYLRETGISAKDQGGKEVTIFKAKRAVCFNQDGKVIRTYYPATSCSLDKFYPLSVCRACRNKKKYAGYFWMYEDEFCREPKYKAELNEFNKNADLGILPELDISYNNLSYNEKLKLRPKSPTTEETKRKISIKNKGRKKNISEETKKLAREKAKQTLIKKNKQAGRKKIRVISPTGDIFESLTDCGIAFGVSRHTIKKWIRSQPNKGFRLA